MGNIRSYFSFSVSWDKQSIQENFDFISKSNTITIDVPFATLWSVWRMRNNIIFQNGRPDCNLTGSIAIGWLLSYDIMKQILISRRVVSTQAEQHGIVGSFDEPSREESVVLVR